jgi:alpha-D-ribose 1-methylphosphonate 5-triphosphate diphosphatase
MREPASVPTGFNSSSAIDLAGERGRRSSADRLPFSLTNARVVFADRIERTSIVVRDGRIDRIGAAHATVTRRFDCAGDYVLPGLVELHTDNIERHLEPRPGTFSNVNRAVLAHDAELASSGITTAFDAITLGGTADPDCRSQLYLEAVQSTERAAAEGLLRVDHRLHLRCELSDPRFESLLSTATSQRIPQLISLMDHTPGQGQWTDIERFRQHYMRRYGLGPAEIDELIAWRQNNHMRFAQPNRHSALTFAKRHSCIVAHHDAATGEEVDAAHADACTIAEFPTSLTAARRAREVGLRIVAGAPNLVRGGSHSGNVSAARLAEEGLCDVLSSDYCPSSLLHAVFVYAQTAGSSLPFAVLAATSTPASALGLNDRGSIAEGSRADLIRVRDTPRGPVVISTWSRGRQVA